MRTTSGWWLALSLGGCHGRSVDEPACTDADGDGAFADTSCPGDVDCDDDDALRFPGATDVPDDGIDQDCSGGDPLSAAYVATWGNDTWPGTKEQPVASISRAVGLAPVVRVGPGTWSEQVLLEAHVEGGYDDVTWERDPESFVTRLADPSTTKPVLVHPPGGFADVTVSGVTLDGTVIAVADPEDPSLTLRDVRGDAWLVSDRPSSPVLVEACDLVAALMHEGTTLTVRDSVVGRVWEVEGSLLLERTVVEEDVTIEGGTSAAEIVDSEIRGGLSFLSAGTLDVVGTRIVTGGQSGIALDWDLEWTARVARSVIEVRSVDEWAYGIEGEISEWGGAIASSLTVSSTLISLEGGNRSVGIACPPASCVVANSSIAVRAPHAVAISSDGDLVAVNSVFSTVSTHETGVGTIEATGTYELPGCAWTPTECGVRAGEHGACTAPAWVVDHGFADAGGHDLRLYATSPLVDAGMDPATIGITDPDLAFDAWGDARPSGAGWDVGADEWTADPPPPELPDPDDLDADGFAGGDDCDDTNASVHPGTAELCDGVDTDCDPATGEAGLASWLDPLGVWRDAEVGGSWISEGPGDLYLCEGIWPTFVGVQHTVRVHGSGVGATVLDGSISYAPFGPGLIEHLSIQGDDPRIRTWGSDEEDVDVIRHVEIDGGDTALLAEGSVRIEDVAIRGAAVGIHLDGPQSDLERVDVSGCTEGGIHATGGEARLTDCDVHGNDGVDAGGIYTDGDLVLVDTRVYDNSGADAGGIYVSGDVTCTATGAARAGVYRNTMHDALPGSALRFGVGTFVSEGCDLGEGADDNQADEIWSGPPVHGYGADAWFACDGYSCSPAP